jgi:hypothetical protein
MGETPNAAADPAAGHLARIDQALVDALRADVARQLLDIARLQSRVSELESPQEVWWRLKPAAVDAQVPYEKARKWAALGLIKARKDGGVIVEMGSLIARRLLLSGK